ncbi:lamin tail domain-containing protein [Rubrivirga marina]|uniref:LTD domain-containing protein n=1 Tax=Rubrivirga marina TaxID=1196024 RepID=A0A271IYJ9_9BACT|nr:lamin tail domain-containing protein [Rubrivirga marina]PAP76293.1 hypothetical protein BSZ37_07450 [Rubrivirga marina]
MRRSRLLLLLTAAALAACSDAVDPTLGTDRVFSLYGYLDPTADRQAIRVAPIYGTIDADTVRAAPARVASVERETGREVAWRDSAVTFQDGSVGHVFVADYTPTPGATVDVRVEETAEAGRVVTTTVTVPPVRQARMADGTRLPRGTYRVEVQDVPHVQAGVLRVHVLGLPGTEVDKVGAFDIGFESLPATEAAPGTWAIEVPFLVLARDELQRRGLAGVVELVEVEFVAFVTNEAWGAPLADADPDALVEPGTFSNVDGGFGFVGAGYRTALRWTPSFTVQAWAGFKVDIDPASRVRINEVSLTDGWVEFYNTTPDPVQIGGYTLTVSDGIDDDGSGPSYRIPDRTTVQPGEFYLAQAGLVIAPGDRVQLLNTEGSAVQELYVDPLSIGIEPATAFGAYPDGFTLPSRPLVPEPEDDGGAGPTRTPQVDVFAGPNVPTPGGPNAPLHQHAFVNEVLTSGADGWVEVLSQARTRFHYRITSSLDRILEAPEVFVDSAQVFGSSDEGGLLELSQTGGEVFLLVRYFDPTTEAQVFRVMDVRAYGPQTPGRSTGALPDGPGGVWTDGLPPTREAPNAAPRLLAGSG